MSDPAARDHPTPAPPSGRTAALAALFERYRAALFAYFVRRTGNAADAEDLVQDVFIRLSRLEPGAELHNAEGFLFRIAVNLLRDRARRNHIRRAVVEPLDDLADPPTPEPDAERVLLAKADLKRVMALLDALAERTRNIFILRRFEQMRCEDIAGFYGISVSAVEQHIKKALAHLAQAAGRP